MEHFIRAEVQDGKYCVAYVLKNQFQKEKTYHLAKFPQDKTDLAAQIGWY